MMVKKFSGTFSTNLCQYVFQTISREKMLIIFIKLPQIPTYQSIQYHVCRGGHLFRSSFTCLKR